MARRLLKYARTLMILFMALASIVVAALAIHSYTYAKDFDMRRGMEYMPTYVYYVDEQHCIYFTSLRGYFRVGSLEMLLPQTVPRNNDARGLTRMPDPICASEAPTLCTTHCYGLLLSIQLLSSFGNIRAVAFPHWLLFVLLAAYPTIAFVRGPLRRWRRKRKGSCLKCGYNLTGNVSGRCPECGVRHGSECTST